MHCNTCKTDVAARIRVKIDEQTKQAYEMCDVCSSIPGVDIPDVFFIQGETSNEQLCDPKTGIPYQYSSKREKAAIMKMLKVRQADSAEQQHGSRNEMYLHRKTYFT